MTTTPLSLLHRRKRFIRRQCVCSLFGRDNRLTFLLQRPSVEDDNEEHGAVMRKILEMKVGKPATAYIPQFMINHVQAKEDPNANRVTSSLNEAARLKAREAAEKEVKMIGIFADARGANSLCVVVRLMS